MTAGAWFEWDGRPLKRVRLTGASGDLELMLGPRLRSEIVELAKTRPPGVVAAHACARAACQLIDYLRQTWPHDDFPGNAARDWRDFVSLAAALRHVAELVRRDPDLARTQRVAWPEAPDTLPQLNPVCDWQPFYAAGAGICPAPALRLPVRGSGDAGIAGSHPSYHRAVRAVILDVDATLTHVLTHVGLLRDPKQILRADPDDDDPQNTPANPTWPSCWKVAVERVGDAGPAMLERIWTESRQLLAQEGEATRSTPRTSIWPVDYWPAWQGIEHLLRAEVERVPGVAAPVAVTASAGEPADEWLTIAAAAERADLSLGTVRGWVRRGRHQLEQKTIGGIAHVRLADVLRERDAKAQAGNPLNRANHHRRPSAAMLRKQRAPGARKA